jgi:WD40 repeat protein
MELVRGVKLTDYCDQHKLSTGQRLDLFLHVCRAIQHAHQKGIIHRDIKPSNILVTLHDGIAVPKVIDFGIAKATHAELSEQTVYTQYQQFIGTPAYMSPEQAEMSGLDIDTRSDIYSLGVLLYELLTGKTPFDPKELLEAGLDEMRRTIREKEPLRPSTRLSSMQGADLTTAASQRQAEAVKLVRLVRGDLDWIVMKCLEKDRTRRYETANGLATDVVRYLSNEPVVARPPSSAYRLQKLYRRNKVVFTMAAAVVLALLSGTLVATWQALRATRAQRIESVAKTAADAARSREVEQRHLAEENASKATASQHEAQRLLYDADMKLAYAAWEEGNLAQMTSLLETHQPKRGEADTRGFEYFYLQELTKGEQDQVLSAHTNAVYNIAVSPNGRWFATRSPTETKLWDLTRRSAVASWPSPSAGEWDQFVGVSFSYDNRLLAFPSAEGLQLCDLATRQCRLLLPGVAERPFFSPVTNWIAFNTGPKGPGVRIWDYEANKELGVLGPHSSTWCWTPDGKWLLTGLDGVTTGHFDLWDATACTRVETIEAGHFLFGLTMSKDGRLVAASDWQGPVWLLRDDTKVLGTVDSGDIRSSALAFSPDGRFLATSSRDQAIQIWDVELRQRVRQLRGHKAKIVSLAYTPDGQLLISGDRAGKVLLWELARESSRSRIPNHLFYIGWSSPRFSADGKLVALQMGDHECSIVDTSSLQSRAVFTGHSLSFSPDGSQVAYLSNSRRERRVCLAAVGASTNRATIQLDGEYDKSKRMEISPDGKFLYFMDFVEKTHRTVVLDAVNAEEVVSIVATNFAPASCFFSDSQTWVCTDGPVIGLWNLPSRQKVRSLVCGSPVFQVAVSPDGKILATTRGDFKISLWDLIIGKEVEVLAGHQAPTWGLAFSPDGRTLASGSEDRTVKLWDLAVHREIASVPQEKSVEWLSFSPDGQMLISGGIGFYQLWRAPRPEALPVANLSFAANSKASSLWQIPDGELLPRRIVEEKEQCRAQLLKIHEAIMAYKKDHQQLPDWLSDLVPKYLADTNTLICPSLRRIKVESRLAWSGREDPKIAHSYFYDFSARSNQLTDPYGLAAPGDSMKSWKSRQLARYGDRVPLVLCASHGPVLSLTYGGEYVEGPAEWQHTLERRWRTQNPAAAEEWFRKVEKEGNLDVLKLLSWHWATSPDPDERDGQGALRLAERAVQLTNRQDADPLHILAAAYAETGQFDKAVRTAREALALLTKLPEPRTAMTGYKMAEYERQLVEYQQHRPWREEE